MKQWRKEISVHFDVGLWFKCQKTWKSYTITTNIFLCAQCTAHCKRNGIEFNAKKKITTQAHSTTRKLLISSYFHMFIGY